MKKVLQLWLAGWRPLWFVIAMCVPGALLEHVVYDLPMEYGQQNWIWLAFLALLGPLVCIGIFRLFYPAGTESLDDPER